MSLEETHDLGQLVERIEALEARVEELESASTDATEPSASNSGYGDHRDQDVLATLHHGQKVGLGGLRKRYRRETDISNSRTVKQRIKSLTQDGPFRRDGRGWVYTGGDVDE